MAYRFSEAAAAIGITEAALRNWMTRNKLDLFEERPEGGWRTFSENDVLVLALAAKLVTFGAKVDEAVQAAGIALANVNFSTMAGLPRYYWAAPSRFGGWHVDADEGMTLHQAADGGAAAIRIAPTMVLAGALKLLRAAG